jgi:hypothetical protein
MGSHAFGTYPKDAVFFAWNINKGKMFHREHFSLAKREKEKKDVRKR